MEKTYLTALGLLLAASVSSIAPTATTASLKTKKPFAI